MKKLLSLLLNLKCSKLAFAFFLILSSSFFTLKAQYTVLHDFHFPTGFNPGQVTLYNGKLYGEALSDNYLSTDGGFIFSINPDGTGFTDLVDFNATNGNGFYPNNGNVGGLVHSGGLFYGMTNPPSEGPGDYGSIFTFNPTNNAINVLFNFDLNGPETGENPYGNLTINGTVMYGTVSAGDGHGAIFSINTDGTNYTTLHSFDNVNHPELGFDPSCTLTLTGGKLFGIMNTGGPDAVYFSNAGLGYVFSMNTDGSDFTDIHDFSGTDGYPVAFSFAPPLTLIGNTLYGVADGGGTEFRTNQPPYGFGVLFSINTDGSDYTVTHYFDSVHGYYPTSSLTLSNGVFYGTAAQGGTYSDGIIYAINPDGSGFSDLHNINNNCYQGRTPFEEPGGIVVSGNMAYGTTFLGGAFNDGAIFSDNLLCPDIIVTMGSFTNIGCNGNSTGSASIASVSGGVSPYTYLWLPSGGTSTSATGLSAGTYTLTVEDNNGCYSSDCGNVFVIQPPLGISGFTNTNLICNGASNGSSTVSVSGGTSPFTYSWSDANSQASATAYSLGAGTYTITVTDACSTAVTASSTITQPTVVSLSIASQTNVNCYGGSNGSATANPATGGNEFVYTAYGDIYTVAGDGSGGYNGDHIYATSAELNYPAGVALDGSGNLYISEDNGNRIRKVNTAGIITTVAGNGTQGYNGDGIAATAAEISIALDVAVDAAGNIYIADGGNNRIRKVNTAGIISTIAGNGTPGYNGDGIAATLAEMSYPIGVAVDALGNVFISDYYNNSIRKVNTAGIISTVAGIESQNYGFSGDGGPATAAELFYPEGIVVDGSGNLFIADRNNNRIREVNTAGIINTVIGNGTSGFSGDGSPASAAELYSPIGITLDGSGNIYIADDGNSRMRKVNTAGIITTFAGNGSYGYNGDGIPALTGEFNGNYYVAVDASGNVYIADENNHRVREVKTGSHYTYSWYPGGGTGLTVSNLAAGVYTITATDSLGCTGTASVNITQPNPLGISGFTSNNLGCSGQSNGRATVNVSGGTPAYTYSWTNGGTTATISNLTWGTYTVTVTDSCGASVKDSTAVGPVTIVSTSSNDALCYGEADGFASVTVTEGTTPYTYSWSDANSQTTATAIGLSANVYTVTITDACSATATASVIINQPTQIQFQSQVAFTFTTSIQSWTVPAGITQITVTANGGGGGGSVDFAITGGAAATIIGLVSVTPGDVIDIVTGGVGTTNPDNESADGGAGGGGSFVWDNTTSTLLVVAGGGGGGSYNYDGNPASTSTNPTGYNGGTGEGGGLSTSNNAGGGGAGYLGNGASTYYGTGQNGGQGGFTYPSFAGGAGDSLSNDNAVVGGYGGGGGAGAVDGGGGGGYNGGGSGQGYGGGGGSSFVNGFQAASSTTITGNGSVIISYIGSPFKPIVTSPTCSGQNNGTAIVSAIGGTGTINYAWNDPNTTTGATLTAGAGTYTVTATDANSCSATASVTISNPVPLTITGTTANLIGCNGGSNGEASVSVSGGTTPYYYFWSNVNEFTDTATGLSAGTYTVSVTDGCSLSATAAVTIGPVTIIDSASTPACNGGGNGTASVTVNGGTTPYTYSWNDFNNQTTNPATGLTPGEYSVIVSDSCGNTTSASVTVNTPNQLNANDSVVTNVSCNGGNNGSATVVDLSGGATPYTYQWSDYNNQTTQTATGLGSGYYYVYVQDNCGSYLYTNYIYISQPDPLGITGTTSYNIGCRFGNFQDNGVASVSTSGGTSPYTYSWSNAETTETANSLTWGTYSVTVTDSCGSSVTASVTIGPVVITISSVTNVSCNGGSNGSASVTLSQGTPPYTYSWSDLHSQTTSTATGLTVGSYTVTVTDNCSATATTSVSLTQPTAVAITMASQTNPTCDGGYGTATSNRAAGGTPFYIIENVAGDYNSGSPGYSGDGGSALSAELAYPNGVAVDGSGNIFFTDQGNNIVREVVYSSGTIITVAGNQAEGSGFYGDGGPATSAELYGPASVAVDGSGNIFIADKYNQVIREVVSSSGNIITVAGNNAFGFGFNGDGGPATSAELSDVAGVSVDGSGNIFIADQGNNVIREVNYNTGNISTVAGNATFGWGYSGDGGAATAAELYSPTDVVPDASGNLFIADEQNNVIREVNHITGYISTVAGNPSSGFGYSGNGGLATAAKLGNPDGVAVDASGNIFIAEFGNELIRKVDANGIISTVAGNDTYGYYGNGGNAIAAELAYPTGLALDDSGNVLIADHNNQVIRKVYFNGLSNYDYSWSPSGGTNTTASNLTAGTYTITAIDANGCNGTTSVTITQPAALTITGTTANNPNNEAQNNGSASVSESGGTTPYTYSWSDNASSSSISNLTVGTYTVTVTDACSNSVTASVNISVGASSLVANATVTSNVSCNGGSNGSASSSPTGGASPYTYSWQGGTTSSSLNGLSAGTYTLTVTDNSSNTVSASVTITQSLAITASASQATTANCNGGTGTATANASGGTGGITYMWNNSSTGATLTAIGGTYTVTATDTHGCTASASAVITQPATLTLTARQGNSINCFGGTGTAIAHDTGGTPPITLVWNDINNSTGATLTALAGTYTVTATDINNCSAITSVVIIQPATVTASASQNTAPSCFGNSNGTATAGSGGGTGTITYKWNDGNSTIGATLTAGIGTYTVTATDTHGCSATASATITQPNAVTASASQTSSPSCFGSTNGKAIATSGGGSGGITYKWNNGNSTAGATLTAAAGTYTVTATDQNSCSATASVIITQPAALTASASITPILCYQGTSTVTVSASGGTGPYNNTGTITLNAGTYTLTVTDHNGCSVSGSVSITQPGLLLANASVVSEVSCFGCSNGSVHSVPSGGTSPYTYSWQGGSTSSTISGLTAGTYTLTVTDAGSCTASGSVTITQPNTQLSANATVTANVLCNGGNNGSASSSPSGGLSPYTYLWQGGTTTSAVSNLLAGTYTITVTDNNGSTASASISITQPNAVSATASQATAVLCHSGNGTATANGIGGAGGFTYAWTGGSTGATLTAAAGTYTVTASDANSCSVTASVVITQPTSVSVTTGQTTAPLCHSGNGTATANGTGGAGGFTYTWTGGSTGATLTAGGGTYTVTASDANSCSVTASVVITQPTSVSVTTGQTTAPLCHSGNGTATANGTGGAGGFTYAWTGGSTGATLTAAAGTYTVTASDANSCSVTASVIITQPGSISVAASQATAPLCNGGNGTAMANGTGGVGGFTYLWTGGSTGATLVAVAGTYTITASDANSCSVTASIIITQPAAVSVSASQATAPLCHNGNGTATANGTGGVGGFTYLWTGGSTGATLTAGAGTYTVIASDANSCSVTASVIITQPAAVSVSASQATAVLCHSGNGTATANGTGGAGGFTYAWTGGSTGATLTAAAGTYTVTASDANSCSVTASVVIAQPTSVSVTTGQTTAPLCHSGNGTATANGTGGVGGFTYTWTGGSTGATLTAGAGTYTVTASDANSCSVTASVVITQPTSVSVTTGQTTAPLCHSGNGTATANGTGGAGGFTYAWTGGSTGATLTAAAGTYTVTASDANSCSVTASVIITQPGSISVAASQATAPLCHSGNGTATANGTGGAGGFTYTWTGGSTGATLTAGAGTYTVTASDANSCSVTASVVITQPTSVSVTTGQTTAPLCHSGNGTATANGTGGAGGFTYTWTGGSTGATLTAAAGTYTVTASDANSCSVTASVVITQPTSVSVTTGQTTAPLCHSGNGTATANGTGGAGGFTYTWTGGSTGATLTAGAGTYTVTASDANSCSVTASVVITQPGSISVAASQATAPLCNGGNGTAMANGTGGAGGFTYAWTGGSTGATLTAAAGTYTVTASDANSCSVTASVIITQPAAVSVSASQATAPLCHSGNGTATANGTGGAGGFTYAWTGGSTGATLTAGAGTYTVTASDANSCSVTASVVITQPTSVSVTTGQTTAPLCHSGNGTATANGTGGVGGFTYTWTGGSTGATLTAAAGTYTVTASDANSCSVTAAVTITAPPAITITSISQTGSPTCLGKSNGQATANATGGTGTLTYKWNDINSTTGESLTAGAGTFTVTVTDANSCSAMASVIITQPLTPCNPACNGTVTAIQTGTPQCNGSSNGMATASSSAGTAPITFKWSNYNSTTGATLTAGAGIYTVTITDANSCTASASVIITQPGAVTVNAIQTSAPACFSETNGSVIATASGGTGTITYLWSNTNTGGTLNAGAGTYTVTATDANGCIATTSLIITQPAAVSVSASQATAPLCHNGNGTATANGTGGVGGFTYLWTGGSTGATLAAAAGTYTVTASDANSCSVTASVIITQPAAVSVSASQATAPLCNNGNGTATANGTGGVGGFTYLWTGGSTGATLAAAAGTYTVTASDANSCSVTASVIITQPAAVSVSASQATAPLCNGGNGTAAATGTGGVSGFTYAWTGGSTGATLTAAAGTYTVTASDANSCSVTASVIITQPAAVSVSASQATAPLCNGGNGTAAATGTGGVSGFTYAWTGGSTGATLTAAAGTYTVTASDANSCSVTASVIITQPVAVSVSASQATAPLCNGGNGTAAATGTGGVSGFTYAWTGGSTGATLTAAAGTYTVTASDANSCSVTASVIITQPNPVTVSAGESAAPTCHGNTNGNATALASGGTGTITYHWNNSNTGATLTGGAGTYTLTATDANGCTASASAIITQPATVTVGAGEASTGCGGSASAIALASSGGGTGTITYRWNDANSSTGSVLEAIAGTYTVTATDTHSCSATQSINIVQPVALADGSPTHNGDVTCNGGNNGSATAAIASGGTSPYSYAWTGHASQISNTISSLSAGTYTITVTDAHGCTATASGTIIITQPAAISASTGQTSEPYCAGQTNGASIASANGGALPFTYKWNDSHTTIGATLTAGAGTYTVTVTDNHGCTGTASITITQPGISTTGTAPSCAGSTNGSAAASDIGGPIPITYRWNNAASSTASSIESAAGAFMVTVTDGHGCSATAGVTIPQGPTCHNKNPDRHSGDSNDVAGSDLDSPLLYQNIPNPFTIATKINYYLPEGTIGATLVFFDIYGRQVQVINLNQTGDGTINISPNTLSAGFYSYSLVVNNEIIDTKRMVLVR